MQHTAMPGGGCAREYAEARSIYSGIQQPGVELANGAGAVELRRACASFAALCHRRCWQAQSRLHWPVLR